MISELSNITNLFEKMGKDGFDTGNELKWGFFFVDDNKENLESVFNELKDHGYRMEKLEFVETEEWMLYVSKIEILTPEKLHKRNIAFNELAVYCGVKLYDGWDVERV